jgi:hypothetical protein
VSYAITIVAQEDDARLLQEAANDVTDVVLSEPESLETAGDGLNFPIDPDTAIEGLKVLAAFVATVNGVRQLIEAWSVRRAKALQDSNESKHQIVIADVNSGDTLYVGLELNSGVARDVADAVERRPNG